MRKITLLLVALFAAVGSAFAQPADGDVGYLYNLEANKFISGDIVGTDGRNHATTSVTGIKYTIIIDSGKWRFDTGVAPAVDNEGNIRLSRCQDNSQDRVTTQECWGWSKWDVKTMDGQDGFRLYNQYAGTSSNFAKNNCLTVQEDGSLTIVPEADATFWIFVSEADYETYVATAIEKNKDALVSSVPTDEMDPAVKQALDDALAAFNDTQTAETYNALAAAIAEANASIEENKEASETRGALALMNEGAGPKAGDDLLTVLFPNAGFDASNNADGWTVTTKGGNNPSYKVENGNCGMTKYQGTIKMEKTIKGLPAGWYTLKAQAFARKGNNASNIEKYNAGEELEVSAYIFANDVQKQAKNILEGAIAEKGAGTYSDFVVGGETKYVLNNSNSGSYVFSLGEYAVELIVYVAEGEALTFGYNKPTDDTDDYCGCDNFRLIYEGTAMPQTFADGKYYLYNVASGKYWGAFNNWGTKASLVEHPEYITLHYKENGYQMETQVNNGGAQYYFNGDFMDNGSPKSLFIVPFGKYYKIYASDAVYGYDGTSTVLGTQAEGDAAAWQIFTEDDMKAQLAKATAKEPVDATFLILNPNFGRNNRWGGSLSTNNNQVKNADLGSAWSFEAGNKDVNGDVTNYCVESYHTVFALSQTISGAPKGTYTLTAQGFYRQDGSDNDNLPVFFANDKNATFPLKTGSENSMSDASKSFTNGLYTIEPIIFEVGDDGTITLGAKLENNTSLWCIWDNFVLKYYGPDATELDVKAAQAIEDYQKALAEAQKVDLNAKMNVSLKSQFETSLDTYAEDKVLTTDATKESIEQATAILTQMTETVKSNIADYAATAKALETYGAKALELDAQGQATYDVADIEAVYNDCTMESDKSEDVLAAFETAVKAQGVGADMTGAVRNADCTAANNAYWTIEGGNTFHTNTWSTENDESGLKVPFIEDWVGGGKTLADATITHVTIEGLPAGKYSVSGFIRAFAEDHADVTPTGACIFANGVDGDDISTGTTAVFNSKSGEVYGTYTVKCEVGDDGLLTFGIKVKDANDFFDWIAFKNFTVIYEDLPTAITEVAGKTAIANNNAIFNIAGQQMDGLQKGINIVDGQKVFVK